MTFKSQAYPRRSSRSATRAAVAGLALVALTALAAAGCGDDGAGTATSPAADNNPPTSGSPPAAGSPTSAAERDFCVRYDKMVDQVQQMRAELRSDLDLAEIQAQLGDLRRNAQAVGAALGSLEQEAQGRLDAALTDVRAAVDAARGDVREAVQESGIQEARSQAAEAITVVVVAWTDFQQAVSVRCS
jgi:hypothetical protein